MKSHSKAKAVLALVAVCSWWLLPCALQAGVSLKGGLTHERIVRPGETYEGVVAVINTGHEEQEIEVYQTDYRFTCDGDYYYDEPGTSSRSNASWVEFSPRALIVPPGGTVDVGYMITVPADSNLAGTYWSILMVEVGGGRASPASSGQGENIELGINQIVRYGVQIVNHVGDTGERRLDFLDTRIIKAGRERVLEVDLENIGERWLRPLVWAELYDADGEFAGRFDGGTLRIFPGTSVRYEVDLSGVSGGEYKAVVVADCGADDVFGATYIVIFEHEDQFTVH
jgi:hypothetical protein